MTHLHQPVAAIARKDFVVLRLDPKIAAGPVTLAISDVFTLLFYLVLASLTL
jgi:hypothetical protein